MQRCQRASGRYSAALSIRPRQASEMINCTFREAAVDQATQKRRLAGFVLLGAFADAQNLPISFGVDRTGHKKRDVADLTGPGALHHDAVEIKIWMFTFDP